MVNNIRNNTISEISAKKDLNTLNEIKYKNNKIIKYKKPNPKHKELTNLFNNLSDIILTDKTLMSSKDEDKNEKEKEKENGNENDKTLMPSKKRWWWKWKWKWKWKWLWNNELKRKKRKNKRKKWCFRWNNWQIKIIWRANKIVKRIKKFKWLLWL